MDADTRGFWSCTKLFRVVKGSRGSKKSKTTALWFIYNMMKYPDANALVVRRVYSTIRESCFEELLWAIDQLGYSHLWSYTVSPLKLTYLPTGQVILFRGMDNATKITSIAVHKGYLCWVWIEEAYEILNEAEFDKLYMSIRGYIPKSTGLFKQFTLTFNPWSQDSWLKTRFFDNPNPKKVWTGTTTFRDNEFLGPDDIERYLEWYERDPRGARVVCDGDWGIAEGLIYTNWEELPLDFDISAIFKRDDIKFSFGLDFGYTVSYNAFVAFAIDLKSREIWVYDEMYNRGMTNLEIARTICQMGYGKEEIWADSADKKSIFELQQGLVEEVPQDNGTVTYEKWQLPNIHAAMKGPDSVSNGIQRLQSFKIWVMPKCRNMIINLNNYAWEVDKDGKYTGKPIKEWDHLCLVGDTHIITSEGSKNLSDIREGDIVLSHLGWRPVTAFAMTDDDAEIWELVLENGTTLEGTWNHPIITIDGVKYLRDITQSDKVILWQTSLKSQDIEIQMQNMLNMTDCSGIGIQIPPLAQKGCISGDITSSYTDMCGKNTTDQSKKDVTSTTSTEIVGTMTSPTLKCCPLLITSICIPPQTNSKRDVASNSKRIGTNVLSGTGPKREDGGILSMERELLKNVNKSSSSANIAEKSTLHIDARKTSSAQTIAEVQPEEHPAQISRSAFVKSVVELSQQTDIPNPPVAVVPVHHASVTSKRAPVYSITVDEAHDFFANGILVRNCDALRYGAEKFFIRGRGHVAEAKGIDLAKGSDNSTKYKSRRVVSSTRS